VCGVFICAVCLFPFEQMATPELQAVISKYVKALEARKAK